MLTAGVREDTHFPEFILIVGICFSLFTLPANSEHDSTLLTVVSNQAAICQIPNPESQEIYKDLFFFFWFFHISQMVFKTINMRV